MGNSVRHVWVRFELGVSLDLLENQLHELTCRSIDSQCLCQLVLDTHLISSLLEFSRVLSLDIVQRNLHQHIQICFLCVFRYYRVLRVADNLVLIINWLVHVPDNTVFVLLENVGDEVVSLIVNHVINNFSLGIQNDVSQLTEVFNYVLGFKL